MYSVQDDIYDEGEVKQVYVFSKKNTPAGIKEVFNDLRDYSAAVVYKYTDNTWGLAYSIKGIDNPDYECTCDFVREELGKIADEYLIDILCDDEIEDVDFFIPENLHRYYYA